eukprot:TRINITY_DN19973_c0_g1_i1.p1 TRINITY_DN19973_c0_g1~~TRINITY_DN19973_c0_g1_i1.p1  ORF type:complete len:123 (-),score=7.28 TRINITY_DN19973_c0_g1_i1:34-402(-)
MCIRDRSIIYQSYNPTTQQEAKEYISHLLDSKGDFHQSKNWVKEAANSRYPVFGSNFECGNLQKVLVRSELEFDLYLNGDTNGSNKCQWFYFSVSNIKKAALLKFNIAVSYTHLTLPTICSV